MSEGVQRITFNAESGRLVMPDSMVMSCFNKNYDYIELYPLGDGQLTVTQRVLDNNDVFMYFQAQGTRKPASVEILLNRITDKHTFDALYSPPPYDLRYGRNMLTGLFAFLDLGRGSAMVSKVYSYRTLEEKYTEKESSTVLELVDESGNIEIDDSNTLRFNIGGKAEQTAFYILLSDNRLFRSLGNLNDYMEYYFASIANNAVQCSFFMLPDGTYTKLPYSIEPFSRNAYGFSLHHNSRRDMLPFLEKTMERFYVDLLCNAVLQVNLYHAKFKNIFQTPYTSKWLKDSTGITAPFVDTRLNEFYVLSVLELRSFTNTFQTLNPLESYVEFLDSYFKDGGAMYRCENGYFFPDYFKDGFFSHASLNHQIGTAVLFSMAIVKHNKPSYRAHFNAILDFIVNTTESWVNQETGDLFYSVMNTDSGKLLFFGEDYVYVTLYDLLNLQDKCVNTLNIGFNSGLTLLINKKIDYLSSAGYGLFLLDAVSAPNEDIKCRDMSIALYKKLYGEITTISEPLESAIKQYEELQNEFNVKTVRLPAGIMISGYEGEYIFEKIDKSKAFYEQQILEKWLPFIRNARVIYDIGANIGNHTVFFAKNTTAEQIFSFEPMPYNYELLLKNVNDNNLGQVTVYNLAVGECPGKAYMAVVKARNNGSATIMEHPADGCISVDMVSVDALNLPMPDFIKIDVEGFELSVLMGLRQTLSECASSVWIEVDETNSDKVYEFMEDLGYGYSDSVLLNDNNVLFVKDNLQKRSAAILFNNLLLEAIQNRNNRLVAAKQLSKYTYEQNKANNLNEQLQSMASKFTFEQNKANGLTEQLQGMVSKFTYEQNKANDLNEQLQDVTSKFTLEQNKANGLNEQLQDMTSKFTYEQNKANNLTEQLREEQNNVEHLSRQVLSEQSSVKKLEEQIKSENAKFSAQANKMQEELDMYRNSKMITFMRYCVWHVPTAARRKLRVRVDRFGRWLYVKLLPHPRIRVLLSKANGKLKIYKNPLLITASKPIAAPQSVIASVSPKSKETIVANAVTGVVKTLKTPGQMNVAMIVDEFSYNSFRYECNSFPLEPDNWREVFEKQDIDFFFCESAWAGVDSRKRPWRGHVYASVNFPNENRGALLEILSYCREKGIPTVFWNKEDPAHYKDRVHDFVKTALEFDHIFTTAEECVERYKRDYGHKSVHLLMFAAQPRLFNPIEKFERTNEIIFAGSWYRQHPVRCEEMERIFDSTLDSGIPLKIYDRQSENDDPNHNFPEKYLHYIHPALPHSQLDTAYKGSKYALNINTVTESSTMFARRVYELMCSNTLVLSNYSKGMDMLFGDNVIFVDGIAPLDLSDEKEKRENCLYAVLRHHTYRQRFEQILADINMPYNEPSPLITLYYKAASQSEAEESVRHFYRMDWENKKCVILIDETCQPDVLQDIVCRFNGGMVTTKSEHYGKTYGNGLRKQKNGGYIINATLDLQYDFINKALLHIAYLPENTAVKTGTKPFTFVNSRLDFDSNMLIPAGCADGEAIEAYVI